MSLFIGIVLGIVGTTIAAYVGFIYLFKDMWR